MVPLAPPRLSMISVWPMLVPILSAMMRAMMSVVLPAAKGTTTRIGLVGYAAVWASAVVAVAAAKHASEAVAARRAKVFMFVSMELVAAD